MAMNILYHRVRASVFKSWEDLKLKCELEWPEWQKVATHQTSILKSQSLTIFLKINHKADNFHN